MQLKRLKTGQIISLHAEGVIGMGGEARIYALHEPASMVAKVYRKPTPARIRKLQCMLDEPPEDPMAGSGHIMIAWPVDLLCTADGHDDVVGFLMPRVTGLHPISSYCNPRWRRQICPLFDWRYLHRMACNLAIAFRALHRRGYVIADVNERNILAGDHALVTLVDTDSFQVPDRARGRILRCPVGTTEFTPRELQGVRFDQIDRLPEHDLFGLGVLVFRVLMEGTHPFEGVFLGSGEPEPYEHRIAHGHFPYTDDPAVPYRPKPLAPPFEILHPELQQLFRRCFSDGHTNPQARPTAEVWRAAIEHAMESLVTCRKNPQHFFGKHLGECPWCKRARELGGRDPFPEPGSAPEPETRFETPVFVLPPPPTPPAKAPSAAAVAFKKVFGNRWVQIVLTVLLIIGVHRLSQRRAGGPGNSPVAGATQPVVSSELGQAKAGWTSVLADADARMLSTFAPQEFQKAKSVAQDALVKAEARQEAPAIQLYQSAAKLLLEAVTLAQGRREQAAKIDLLQAALLGRDRFTAREILAQLHPASLPRAWIPRLRVAVEQWGGADKPRVVTLANGIRMDFIPVRPGGFMMGSDTGDDDEKPLHEVKLTQAFYLAKFEVTQEQWQAVMEGNPSTFRAPQNPVECVSWEDCQRFLARMRKMTPGLKPMLPTEAQWEFACRAGSAGKYSFGDDAKDLRHYAWFEGQSLSPQPVGGRRANPWGLFDMHGNVWEWCADYDGQYPPQGVTDPPGPAKGNYRIVRGGGWSEEARYCRSAVRRSLPPTNRVGSLGFRVCLMF